MEKLEPPLLLRLLHFSLLCLLHSSFESFRHSTGQMDQVNTTPEGTSNPTQESSCQPTQVNTTPELNWWKVLRVTILKIRNRFFYALTCLY
ncbi:hypothetical protein P8452_03123 [Trifolium repens]|nr:hypothetical protein P8452_03123 [Trifolium repens]